MRSRLIPPMGRRYPGWLALTATLLLAACASVPPPNDAMARAQAQLQAARAGGGADADPLDMDFATSKLQRAQMAMSNEKYADAARLVAESQADSQLAFTKAQLMTLRQHIRQRSAENARLRTQLLDRTRQLQRQQRANDQNATELPEQVLPAPAVPDDSAAAPAAPPAAPKVPGGGQ